MDISAEGLHLIASFEGYVPEPYNDSAGNATIGFGHLIHMGKVTFDDVEKYKGFTYNEGYKLLHADAADAVNAVNQGVKVNLGVLHLHSQARFDVLCSLAYNIGGGAFLGSTLLRIINEKGAPRDWYPVSTAFLAWDHAGGYIVEGLLNRRKIEAHAFLTGDLPKPVA